MTLATYLAGLSPTVRVKELTESPVGLSYADALRELFGLDPAAVEAVTALMPAGYRATPERAFFIDVIGWEWNCSQHITPRFTEAEISAAVRPMAAELNQLRAELAALRAVSGDPE